jgi:hypothetical protein
MATGNHEMTEIFSFFGELVVCLRPVTRRRYERSTDIAGVQFNHCQGWSSGQYDFGQSKWAEDFPKLDLNGGGSSDTWYPWWSSDGRWVSTFTDGSVGGIHAQSGGAAPSMHGQTVLEPAQGRGWGQPGDVTNMRVVQAATFAVNATPFAGNYPTGIFTTNASGTEIWYYGTYPVLGGNTSKWLVPPCIAAAWFRLFHADIIAVAARNEDCTNWCSLGPFPGWLWSEDDGRSWHSSGHLPQGAPAFGQLGPDGRPIMSTISDYIIVSLSDSGLTDIYLRFAIPILILVMRSR